MEVTIAQIIQEHRQCGLSWEDTKGLIHLFFPNQPEKEFEAWRIWNDISGF